MHSMQQQHEEVVEEESSRSVSQFFSMVAPMEDEFDEHHESWDDGNSSCYSVPTSTASARSKRRWKKQKIRTADLSTSSSMVFASTSTEPGQSLCCTSIVDPRSFAALQCFRLPQARNKNNKRTAEEDLASSSSSTSDPVLSEAKLQALSKVVSTREGFLAKKVCITRAVFLGLLHRGSKDPHFFVRVQGDDAVNSIKEFKDGTLFTILCIEKVCVALLRTWSLLNTDPGTINKQMQATLDYLYTRRHPGINVLSSSSCEDGNKISKAAWTNFKQSVCEAQILPLEVLALRVMKSSDKGVFPEAMAQYIKDADGLKKRKRLNTDWHTHQNWFMSHMIEYESASLDGFNIRGTKKITIKSYKDWPTTAKTSEDDRRAEAAAEEEDEEDRNNDIRNDQWHDVSRKRYHDSSGFSSTRKLTKNEMKVKAKATPFHPMVVAAVNKAIDEACSFCEF